MRKIAIILLICFVSKAWGNKISDAFEALSIFDYFKAKQLFYKSLSKYPAESSFGLATIYYRSDNPFSNIDSSAKYIAISKTNFKDSISFSSYKINGESILSLSERIAKKGFERYCKKVSVEMYNHFLSHYFFANDSLINVAYDNRDELLLEKVISKQSSDSIKQFLLNYPQSIFYFKAKKLFYDFEYEEKTPQKNAIQYQQFLKQFSNNPNTIYAETNLFQIIKQYHSTDSIYHFIKNYSSDLTKEEAWKLLYSLSVKKYSKEELTLFLNKYPEYPHNDIIVKEISLSQNILLPLKSSNEKIGFIDTIGTWVISPQFDDAQNFSEGFAAVCKNDSCFYIDKEGNKVTNHYF